MTRVEATFEATLVQMDEPQLITLKAGKLQVVAVAITSADYGDYPFFATTVAYDDWEKYLEGSVDLRYLFVSQSEKYTFDLGKMQNNVISMIPFLDEIQESYLPSSNFFSSNHTE